MDLEMYTYMYHFLAIVIRIHICNTKKNFDSSFARIIINLASNI